MNQVVRFILKSGRQFDAILPVQVAQEVLERYKTSFNNSNPTTFEGIGDDLAQRWVVDGREVAMVYTLDYEAWRHWAKKKQRGSDPLDRGPEVFVPTFD